MSYRIADGLSLPVTVAVLALTVMLSMKLIGFLMLAVRHEAVSQILGLLVLENGIFLGSQILVPGMPLLIELVILFDLLVIVACFGVLVALPGRPMSARRAAWNSSGWWADGRDAPAHRSLLAPALAVLGCLLVRHARVVRRAEPRRQRRGPSACALPLPFRRRRRGEALLLERLCRARSAGAWVILCTAIVYLLASIYAVGYMRLLGEERSSPRFLRAVRGICA